MNCTDCGAPHSEEQPLTVMNKALFCPACLDAHNKALALLDVGVDSLAVVRMLYPGISFVSANISQRARDDATMRKIEQAVMKPWKAFDGR